MSTNVTITYNDISTMKSDISVLQGKLDRAAAIFQKRTGSSSTKTLNDLNFILFQTDLVMKKGATSVDIVIPNAAFANNLNNSKFIAICSTRQEQGDTGIYSSYLYQSINDGKIFSTSGSKIGKVLRSVKADDKYSLTVDILFISLNP